MMIDEGKRTGSNDKMFFSAEGTLTAKSEIDDSKNLLFNCNGKVISCLEKINNLVNVMGNGSALTETFIDEINKLNTISNSLQAKVDEFNKLNGILTSGEIDFAQYIADGGSIYVSAKDAVSGKSGLSIGASFLANPLDVYDTKEKKYLHLTKAQLNDAEYMAKLASQSQYALLFGNSYETASGFVPLNKVFKVTSSNQTQQNTSDKMHQPSKNEFVNYYQYNYADSPYYLDTTIKTAGCGTTSMAMVLTYLKGKRIDPIETTAYSVEHSTWTNGAGTNWDYFSKIAADYGINCTESGVSSQNIVDSLKSGKTIIMSMYPGTFTSSGHFIVLTGINDDGSISVADPNSEERSKNTYDISTFVNEGHEMWSFDK